MKAIIQSIQKEGNKAVLQSCIPFLELKDKARFTYRLRPEEDPYGLGNDNYQRNLNDAHVKDIIAYLKTAIINLNKRPTAIFPTSLLIAFTKEDTSLNANKEIIDIEITNDCYIVDGQHRLKAMIDLYNKVIKSNKEEDEAIKNFLDQYKFNCTMLINFDVWEQARIFADVNFKQKKVNKSLYYEIYGQEYSDNPADYKQNGIFLAHSLVEFLNDNISSPLYHQIKMLGNGKGVISQSFLVESLMRHITSPRGIWYFDPYSVRVDKNILQPMKVELFTFLNVENKELSEYWLKDNSILCKTTGMGAMMRLMGYIHRLINDATERISSYDSNNYSEKYAQSLMPYIKKIHPRAEELFSSDKEKGLFSNTGGRGMEMALYRKLIEIIDKL